MKARHWSWTEHWYVRASSLWRARKWALHDSVYSTVAIAAVAASTTLYDDGYTDLAAHVEGRFCVAGGATTFRAVASQLVFGYA